jgi:hypothetical protein
MLNYAGEVNAVPSSRARDGGNNSTETGYVPSTNKNRIQTVTRSKRSRGEIVKLPKDLGGLAVQWVGPLSFEIPENVTIHV